MRTYKTTHAYYCGIDLHARSLYIHILRRDEMPTSEPSRCSQVMPRRATCGV